MKEKIVICTLYESINCGTFLQAYSLKKKLEELNYDVYFLKLKNDNSSINKKREKMNLRTFVRKAIRKVKLKFIFKKNSRVFKTISLEEVNSDKDIKKIVIGSDEIWNVKNNSFKHYKEYFGYNFVGKRIIAYAPCSNDSQREDLENEFKEINFNNFDFLSARDKKTKLLLEEFGEKNVADVVDPTMIVDNFDELNEVVNVKNYVLIYGHYFDEKQIEEIIKFAHTNKYKTVSITKYFSWCDKNLTVSPGKFLAYIKNADYIITSTFHGSVFSILFNKKFAVYANNGSKINDLLAKFGLEDRIIKTNIEKTLNTKIDYEKVNSTLKIMKENSEKYLINALKGDE